MFISKKWVKFSSSFFCLALLASSAFAAPRIREYDQDDDDAELEEYYNQSWSDDRIKQITPSEKRIKEYNGDDDDDETQTVVRITCNVSNAEVYLNGVYKGLAPVEIKGLRRGRYRVEVRKRGYERAYFYINVKRGQELTYAVHLDRLMGYVKVSGMVEGSRISLSSNTDYFTSEIYNKSDFSMPVGTYNVTIRKFGYEDYRTIITVKPFKTSNIDVVPLRSPFTVTKLSSSRGRFNPLYDGSMGKTTFYFSVTAPGYLRASISDEYGEEVWEKKFTDFSTWDNSFEWNGTASDGSYLPDGKYSCTLKWESGEKTLAVWIDRSISYPLANITSAGLGYGKLPFALQNSGTFNYFNFSLGACFSPSSPEFFNNSAISGAWALTFARHGEISLNFGGLPQFSGATPFFFNASMKFSGTMPLNSYNSMTFGGLVHYCFDSSHSENSFAVGALFALDQTNLSSGVSTQLILSPQYDDFINRNCWKNGLTVVFKPSRMVSVSGYAALNSVFGILEEDRTVYSNANDSIEAGAGVVFMPGNNFIQINFNLDSTIIPKRTFYLTGTAGISFVL